MGREAVDMCVADKVEGEVMIVHRVIERKLELIESEMDYCSVQIDEISDKKKRRPAPWLITARLSKERAELVNELTCLADEYQRVEQKKFTRWEWLQIAFESFLDLIAPYDEKSKRKPKEWAYIDEDDTLIFQPGVKVKSILPDRERGTVYCKGKRPRGTPIIRS